ncbi:hypothetical protein MesoLj131c_63560 [Mesorhizobium sp. 131-3-5]|uniref:ATP-dependent DNA ligase n=1 Tax=Mesorhizobium sp. 131-3-5 TaxID=2744520 RepID=UPI001935A16D|nr:ATP-dependent DNA ligase [Mesorhizobium sp. 131-3-5]BCH12098.1 hypothetical protein MesoLj131c_63560 [Mesorhizobium sp. 131-3-5]
MHADSQVKCWDVADFELLGLKREPGKQTVGLMARDGKYAGPATIALTKQMRERLMARVRKGRRPEGIPEAVTGPKVEWLKPGFRARVRYLRGENKLRHASVQDVQETDDNEAAVGDTVRDVDGAEFDTDPA